MRTSTKWAILAGLYMAQGLPYGFFKQALPVIMRDRGASLPEIGLASLLVLPWALKFLWAPLVDRYGWSRIGVRKTWILILQVLGIFLFIGLGLYDGGGGYAYLMWGFFFANLIAATQDIATDGIAVNMLNDKERGFGNGIQIAGYRVGMVIGGGFLLMYFSWFQWQGSFLVIGALILLTTLPVFLYKEPPARAHVQHTAPWRLLVDVFKRKGMLTWIFVAGFYKFGDAMATAMLSPFFRDRGMSIEDIGRLLGTIGFIGGLLGALAGGALVRYTGRYRAVLWFGVIQAIAVFGYYLLALGCLDDSALPVLAFAEHFTGGMATAAIFTAMMDVCKPESGSTDYTVQASFVVFVTGLSGPLAGIIAEASGHHGNFLAATVLSLIGAFVFGVIYRKQADENGGMRLT